MEFRTYSAENYLKKNKPEEVTSELIESVKKLSEPIIDIDYDNSSSAKVEKGSDTLEVSFTKLDDEIEVILRDLLESIGESREYIQERMDTSNWKELTGFEISRNGYSEPILDVIKLLPSKCRILFFPQKYFLQASAVTSDKRRPLILYIGDLSAEIVAPTLLHEIGHIIDHRNLKTAERDNFIIGPGHEKEAEELRRERAATGFEFKILRSRFKNDSLLEKSNIENFSKAYALNTYHNSIDAMLRIKAADWHYIGRHLQHEHEQEMQAMEANDEYEKQLTEFEKIKQTNEYQEWRSKRPDDLTIGNMTKCIGGDEWLEFLETKKTEEFREWKKLPENSQITDEEQERQKFEDDKIERFWREQGLSRPKSIKDIL